MVKGCKKSIVYVKNTGSDYFKEAYFILNEGGISALGEKDLVSEATRIIEEKYALCSESKKGIKRLIKRNALPFLLGLSVGLIMFFVALFL